MVFRSVSNILASVCVVKQICVRGDLAWNPCDPALIVLTAIPGNTCRSQLDLCTSCSLAKVSWIRVRVAPQLVYDQELLRLSLHNNKEFSCGVGGGQKILYTQVYKHENHKSTSMLKYRPS